MSDQLAAVMLGLVQGLTEFLPVSSTAHLILVSDALKLDPDKFGLSFDVALHLETALAVLLYFAGTWIGLLVDVVRGRWRLPLAIVVGTVPAAIAGVLWESAVSTTLRSAIYIVIGLLVGSAIFVLAERMSARRRRIASTSRRSTASSRPCSARRARRAGSADASATSRTGSAKDASRAG